MTATVTILNDEFVREMKQQGVIDHEGVLDIDATKKVFESLRAMGVAEGQRDLQELLRALDSDSLQLGLEKIVALRLHATTADATLTRVRQDHELALTRVNLLRDEVNTQRQKNGEAHAEIATLQRLLAAERGALLSPPVTEPEAALLRLVRQYGCINERGEVDWEKAQAGIDYFKKSRDYVTTPPPAREPETFPACYHRGPAYNQHEARYTAPCEQCAARIPAEPAPSDGNSEYRYAAAHRRASEAFRALTPAQQMERMRDAGVFRTDGGEMLDYLKARSEPVPVVDKPQLYRVCFHRFSGDENRTWTTPCAQCDARIPAEPTKEADSLVSELEQLVARVDESPNGRRIVRECLSLAKMLVAKNKAYGDSAMNPVRIFARDLDPRAQILVRLDDKLSRLARGSAAGEDVILDLLGYLILYRITPAADGGLAVPPAAVDLFKNLVVRPPTPEEIVALRKTAEESEKNSPYQERRPFVECPRCAAQPGSPILCVACQRRRASHQWDGRR